MKKAVTFLLLLFLTFSIAACDTNTESSSSNEESIQESQSKLESESTSQSEIISESESATSPEDTNESESESTTQTELESESESNSEIQSESQDESESESEAESEVIVQVTESGQFSSAITKTKQSADRLKQMSAAAATYNKGAACSESEVSAALSSAKKIQTSGALIGYSNASAFIKHFLGNSGEDYTIDLDNFLSDSNALATRNEELTKALRACEELAVEGEQINVYQKEELVHHNLTGDWKFAVGSYFTSIEIKNLSVNGSIYSATITYKVTDFYNWDYNNDTPVFSGLAAAIVGDVSPKDLHELHRAGKAQEFLSYGEASYTVSWVKGSSVASIPIFNK